MASSRKKQDEKNLKTLRELGALPKNKFCFDCNQRGPTYVNVTIGSFVCTKCSGMLRGLTPPHRVKSISMATFTTEEIDILRNRGNDYCRRVWLGLYEGTPPNSSDEQGIRDLMTDKYERKRYYLDSGMVESEMPILRPPSQPQKLNGQLNTNGHLTNGTTRSATPSNNTNGTTTYRSRPDVRNHIVANGTANLNDSTAFLNNSANNFVVDFDKADIFSSAGNNCNGTQSTTQQNGFANFDNNPVFNGTNANTTNGNFSIFDLKYTESGPVLDEVPLFPRCNVNKWNEEMDDLNPFIFSPITSVSSIFDSQLKKCQPPNQYQTTTNNNNNRWSVPTIPTKTPLPNPWVQTQPQPNHINQNNNNNNVVLNGHTAAPAAFVEDKYAALKDLDNEMKLASQQQEWSSSGGSSYGSPSPGGSMFGSPSQGQFISAFSTHQDTTTVQNPFNNGNINWGAANGTTTAPSQPTGFVNPFREQQAKLNGINGLPNGVFQPMFPAMPANGLTNGWPGNPFKVGGITSSNPNNPFL